jgi:hypothetical protein
MTKLSVNVPTTGTYAKRAEVLRAALDQELREAFGSEAVKSESRISHRKEPIFFWELPDKVSVEIDRYIQADPHVGVSRRDPVDESHGTDWKRETVDRDWKSKAYDVAVIVALARKFVEFNRWKRTQHEANERARADELGGLPVPPSVTVTRDPKTGLYGVWMHTDVKGLTADQARLAIAAAATFKAACPKGKDR